MLKTERSAPDHPFVRAPHRTMLALAVPVLLSMAAEPLTGLVDTAFVARLGAVPLAALGVGATALTSLFWIFNFLQIGTQTEVAKLFGRGERAPAADVCGLGLAMSLLFGALLIALIVPAAPWIAAALGAGGALLSDAVVYLRIRAFGAPAVLLTLAAFGALRGVQEMRVPLIVAVAVNALNIVLCPLLIFGVGPIPALGVAGAGAATTLSQWIGAVWAAAAVVRLLGRPRELRAAAAGKLLVVGGDLFVRTGLLTSFTLLTTRIATSSGADAGAANQAIRGVWTFTALVLDAFALTGQSLIGYFLGANRIADARRVAAVACGWALGAGALLAVAMIAATTPIAAALVPPEAQALFVAPWIVAALAQPLNALAFVTDGIHWGTGDYRYLRNAMLFATLVGVGALQLIDRSAPGALLRIWLVAALWICVRASLGLLRIWPGVWNAPLALKQVSGVGSRKPE